MHILSRIFRKSINDLSDIRNLLQQAKEQHSPFAFFYRDAIDDAPDMKLQLMDAEGEKLYFQTFDRSFFEPEQQRCFFQATFALTLHKNIQSQIYKFSSRTENMLQDDNGLTVRAALPTRLEKIELRKDIRIGLAQEHRPLLRVWKATKEASNGKFDPVSTTQPPLFEMTPGKDCMVMLHNISAGGLKISLSPHCFPEAAAYLNEDCRLQLWMLLPEIGWKNPIECFLPARTTRIQRTPTGWLEFGLHFLHLSGGKIKLPNSDGWVKYTDNGLQILVGWIQRRLEEFDSNVRAC